MIRTPPIEVRYISPPQKSKLLTPQEKKIKVSTNKRPPPPQKSRSLNRGVADKKWNGPLLPPTSKVSILKMKQQHDIEFMGSSEKNPSPRWDLNPQPPMK